MEQDPTRRRVLSGAALSLFVAPPLAGAATAASQAGGQWSFFRSGTTTPAPVYADPERQVSLGSTVVADADGKFRATYLDPSILYRARLKTAAGETIIDADPYDPGVSRGELAAGSGYTLIKHKPPQSGTFARTAAQRIFAGIGSDGTYVNDWIDPDLDEAISHAVGALDVDLAGAFHAAFDIASQGASRGRTGAALIAPGRYTVGRTIETAFPRLQVIGVGRVVLQQMAHFVDPLAGADAEIVRPRILSCDGRANGIYRHSIDGIVIRGNGSAADALFDRSVYNSFRRIAARNVRGTVATVLSGVLNNYDLFCNYRGEGVGAESVPQWGLIVDKSVAGGKTTQCSFDVRVEDATICGLWLKNADTCGFTGAAEGLQGAGTLIEEPSVRNVFSRFYCEKNGGFDWDIRGEGTVLKDQCTSYNDAAGTSIRIRNEAKRTILRDMGNIRTVIEIDADAEDTVLENIICRNLIDRAGTKTRKLGYLLNLTQSMASQSGAQGSFTPSLAGSAADGTLSHAEQVGRHTIVDNLCFFHCRMKLAGHIPRVSGNLVASGLPFAAIGENAAVTIADFGGVGQAAGGQIIARIDAGTREIRLHQLGPDGIQPLSANGLRGGAIVELTGFYRIS